MKLVEEVKIGTILIVDDQQINRLIAKELLQEIGFEVVLANNGLEALALLEHTPVDLVLIDHYMPVMDGIETAVQIRRQEKFKNLPIVALTADMKQEHIVECLQAGMNEVIAKPLQTDVISSVLSRLLPSSSLKELSDISATRRWPRTPWLDSAEALERLNGKEDLYLRMLAKFLEQYADAPIALGWLLDTGDTQAAIRLLHSIRGASAHLGAVDIQKRAAALESSLKHNPVGQLDLESFEAAMNVLIETIDKLLLANG